MGVVPLPMLFVLIVLGISCIILIIRLIQFFLKKPVTVSGSIKVQIFLLALLIGSLEFLYQKYTDIAMEPLELDLIDLKQKNISGNTGSINIRNPFIHFQDSIFYFENDRFISQYNLDTDNIQNGCEPTDWKWFRFLYGKEDEFKLVSGNPPNLIYLTDDEGKVVESNYVLNLEMLDLKTCEVSTIILDDYSEETINVNRDNRLVGTKVKKILNLKSRKGDNIIIVYTDKKIYSYNLTQKTLINEIETKNIKMRISGVADINNDGDDEVLLLEAKLEGSSIVAFDYNFKKVSETSISKLADVSRTYTLGSNSIIGYNSTSNTFIIPWYHVNYTRSGAGNTDYYYSIFTTDGKLLNTINYTKDNYDEIPSFGIVHSKGKELFLVNRTLYDGNGIEILKLPVPRDKLNHYNLSEVGVDIDNDGNDEIVMMNQKRSSYIKKYDFSSGFIYDYTNYLQIVSQDGKVLFNKKLSSKGKLDTIIPHGNSFSLGSIVYSVN